MTEFASVSGGGGTGVTSVNGQTGAVPIHIAAQGRLTLQSATPIMITTQSGKNTIFWTPYLGDQTMLFDGTNMIPTTVVEISVLTTDTAKNPAAIGASKVNDWFLWNDAGTIRISHGPDWTNDTTRSAGTALVTVNGILLNNASITNACAAQRGTYVGTTRSDGSSLLNWVLGAAASGGTAGNLAVWNMYNRRIIQTIVTDNGAGYGYTTGTIRQARASAGNQISFVLGLAEDGINATYSARPSLINVAGALAQIGLGLDTTTAYTVQPSTTVQIGTGAASTISQLSTATFPPSIGYHFISANENGDGVNANLFDAGTSNYLCASLQM